MKKLKKQKVSKQLDTTKVVVPYDTGKVKIGLLYTPPKPPMSADEEKIQAALLGLQPTPDVPWRLIGGIVFVVAVLASSIKRFL